MHELHIASSTFDSSVRLKTVKKFRAFVHAHYAHLRQSYDADHTDVLPETKCSRCNCHEKSVKGESGREG